MHSPAIGSILAFVHRVTKNSVHIGQRCIKSAIRPAAHVGFETIPELRSATDWTAVSALISAHDRCTDPLRTQLDILLTCSRRYLHPLQDPLDITLADHRRLGLDREEAYSDWLQWVLWQIKSPEEVLRILGVALPDCGSDSLTPVVSEREVPVDYGHDDQTGRLDLLLQFGKAILVAVEVKLTDADKSDTEKQEGYWLSLKKIALLRRIPCRRAVLISPSAREEVIHQFRHVTWGHLCIRLRKLAPQLIATGHTLSASLILCFVAAVEQNLLDFRPAAMLKVGHVTASELSRTVKHLSFVSPGEETSPAQE